MGSDIFFHSLAEGETCEVKISEGHILMVKLQEVHPVDNEGMREAVFEVNGNRRVIKIKDDIVTIETGSDKTRLKIFKWAIRAVEIPADEVEKPEKK